MNIHKGFSIFECLVYCALFSLLACMLFGWLSGISKNVIIYNKQQGFGLSCGSDMFARDVRQAPSDPSAWKKITNYALVWSDTSFDIGWLFVNDSLYRFQGNYDASSDSWTQKTKSLVANIPAHFTFQTKVNAEGFVVEVSYIHNNRIHPISLRNRVFV